MALDRVLRGSKGLLVVAAMALTACPKPAATTGADAGSDAFVDSGLAMDGAVSSSVADAGGPELVELPLTIAATVMDGGVEPLQPIEGRVELDPARGFDLEIPVPLDDYRVRLMDWTDQVVMTDDVATVADGGIRYRIDLVQPLVTGRAYQLQIDSEFGPELHDARGRTWDDVRVELKVRGEIPTPPGKPARKPKKH